MGFRFVARTHGTELRYTNICTVNNLCFTVFWGNMCFDWFEEGIVQLEGPFGTNPGSSGSCVLLHCSTLFSGVGFLSPPSPSHRGTELVGVGEAQERERVNVNLWPASFSVCVHTVWVQPCRSYVLLASAWLGDFHSRTGNENVSQHCSKHSANTIKIKGTKWNN
jgi:hypothetical protein